MKIKKFKEERGNLAFNVVWISKSGQLSNHSYDTKEEVIKQVKHLIALGFKQQSIAIYRSYEFVNYIGIS